MFPADSLNQAVHGGGGNRTRERFTAEQPRYGDSREIVVAAIVARDGETCFYCGSSADNYQIDHVVPQTRGGSHSLDNLVLACYPCNYEKWMHPGWIYAARRCAGLPTGRNVGRTSLVHVRGFSKRITFSMATVRRHIEAAS